MALPHRRRVVVAGLLLWLGGFVHADAGAQEKSSGPPRKTTVTIQGEKFSINGKPTYQGRTWQGKAIEGLLFNSRMVQAIFDDLNPETVKLWAYPDTKKWDAERNVREFIAAMPTWRRHGLLGLTLNLQGGSPQGYSKQQPWHNSALKEDGSLARIHEPPRTRARQGRRTRHGRDSRHLLLRPGRAPEK